MPKLSPLALRSRIEQLQKQLAAAEAKKAPAVRRVRALMEKLGIAITDLTEVQAPARRGRRPKATKANGSSSGDPAPSVRPRGKVAAKYRDDKGNEWTGRGKTPRWLVEAEKAGRSRESFRIT